MTNVSAPAARYKRDLAERHSSDTSDNRYYPVLIPFLELIRGTKQNLAHMAVERVERQEPVNDCLSCPELGSGVLGKDKKELAFPEDPDAGIKQEAENPYSIYTLSEKWFIVSMASLAALFR